MELFRFRVVRPVLSQPTSGLDVSALFDPPLQTQALLEAADALAAQVPGASVQAITRWLAAFSSELALRSDLVSPGDCKILLPAGWQEQVGSQEWIDVGHQLAYQLVAAMTKRQPAAAVERLCRQLLVFELVSVLASDAAKAASERTLKTAEDVRAMISWRHVILPPDVFPARSETPLLARRPGVTDFYVVRDEWNHDEAGELAAVINVLPGETLRTGSGTRRRSTRSPRPRRRRARTS